MSFTRYALVPLAALALAALPAAAAEDSGNFVIRLGQDTTSVERYARTDARTSVDQIGRAPRVLKRRFAYDYANGSLTRFTMVVTAPSDTTPTQTIDAVVDGDSIRLRIQNASAPVQNRSVALPKGTVVVTQSSPWSGYEREITKLVQGKSDSLRTTMYLVGADATDWLSLHKLGRDSVILANGRQDVFHLRVDKAGRILSARPIAGTFKVSVERVPSLDMNALGTSFAVREKAGTGMGVLSPRDSVVINAGGASLWVDYSRPSKRGRDIFGTVVPYGELWRTGANAATQFKTDKALDFGAKVVPPGFYTLWTIPARDGWKLIINSETGQPGTAHKAEKDLVTIDMKATALPEVVERFTISVEPNAQGGVLNLDWDTTRASAAFTVKP